jgi:hypothetical protein
MFVPFVTGALPHQGDAQARVHKVLSKNWTRSRFVRQPTQASHFLISSICQPGFMGIVIFVPGAARSKSVANS